MNPHELVPPPDPYGLPAPVWVFVLLLNITLVLHFIAMGYVFATTLLHVFLAAARPGSTAEWMLRRTEGPLPVALSFTITLGVAPLLFVQVLNQPTFYNANIVIGHQWFGMVFVLMAGFYAIYVVKHGEILGRRVPRPLHVAGRLFIFLTIAYMLVTHTVNAILVVSPESWPAVRQAGGNFLVAHPPILWPRLIHNAIAACIIGAVWLIALGSRSEIAGVDDRARSGGAALRKLGALSVMIGVMLQIVVGVWLLLSELPEVQGALLGGRPAGYIWMSSLLGVLALLMLGVTSFAQRPGRLVLALWGALAFVLAGMFTARQAAREIRLAPYLKLDTWVVKTQGENLVLFFVLFAAGIAVVGMMIGWLGKSWKQPGQQ